MTVSVLFHPSCGSLPCSTCGQNANVDQHEQRRAVQHLFEALGGTCLLVCIPLPSFTPVVDSLSSCTEAPTSRTSNDPRTTSACFRQRCVPLTVLKFVRTWLNRSSTVQGSKSKLRVRYGKDFDDLTCLHPFWRVASCATRPSFSQASHSLARYFRSRHQDLRLRLPWLHCSDRALLARRSSSFDRNNERQRPTSSAAARGEESLHLRAPATD